jgi:arginase
MRIDVIGVPMDYGSGRRGVDMGPSAIRYAGLDAGLAALGHQVRDLGNIEVPPAETIPADDAPVRYLDPIVAVLRRLTERVSASVEDGRVALVLGGDHSVALGSVAGAARHRRLGLVWLDTHGDFNTVETTPSGNVHGMPLAALCGYGDPALVTVGGTYANAAHLAPDNVAVVGVRDLDADERTLMRESGIHVYSMEAVDRRGIGDVMRRAIEDASRGTDGIWVSLDLDVVDPMYAPGVGTPFPGGLTFREAHLAAEMLAGTGHVVGLDVVEVNPVLDRANATAALAVELILSTFGKRVWEPA